MSDSSQGPGWWQASNGKWYAPELYPKDWPTPNPGHDSADDIIGGQASPADSAFTTTDAVASEASTVATDDLAAPESTVAAPTDASADESADPWAAPASHASDTVELEPTAAPRHADPMAFEPDDDDGALGTTPSDSVGVFGLEEPEPEPVSIAPAAGGLAAGTAAATTAVPQTPPSGDPTSVWSETPDTDQVAAGEQDTEADKGMPAAVGIVALIAGLAMIVGSFMDWASADGTITGSVNGLSDSNGLGTLICGVVVAGSGALLLAGMDSMLVRAAMGVAAIGALALVLFSVIDIGNTSDDLSQVLLAEGYDAQTASGAGLDLAAGIWIVIIGSVLGVGAAAASLAPSD